MKVMNSILRYIAPLISAIIGLTLMNKYNLFSELNIGPPDKSEDVCISVYFAICDIILSNLVSWISNINSNMDIIFSNINKQGNITETPQIDFNRSGIAEIEITIKLHGKKKHYQGAKVTIKDIGYVDVQTPNSLNCVTIDNNNFIIDIEKLIGNNEQVDIEQKIRMIMIKNQANISRSITIVPYVSKPWYKLIITKNNSAFIRMEDV